MPNQAIVNHMPWDNGSISEVIRQVTGLQTVNKTTKTRCGKRVKISAANHNAPITCEACANDINKEAEFIAAVKAGKL
jgi:hypothetical protein